MPNAVEKTMLILRALSDGRGKPVTLASLSERTGFNKSTVSHILKPLCAGRYVTRVSHSEGYLIGPELHVLTRYGRYGEELVSVCRPILLHLNRQTGGTAVLAVVRDSCKYILDHVEGGLRYSDSDASILEDDLYRTVTGRAILSAMPVWEALDVYETLGAPKKADWEEVTDRESFLAALEKIRAAKVCHAEITSSARAYSSFAVPITAVGRCVGALGLVLVRSADEPPPEEAKLAGLTALMERCRLETERRLRFEPPQPNG